MNKVQKIIVVVAVCIAILFLIGCSSQKNIAINTQTVKIVLDKSNINIKAFVPHITEEEMKVEKPEPQAEEPKEEPKKPTDTTTKKDTSKQTNTTKKSTYPYYIKVNRLANCVTIYKQDENGAYTIPVKAMICSVGKNINKTPTGVFRTSNKYTWRYLFGNQYGQYATRITGHILFHSVPYTSQSKDALKTDYYNNLGVGDSMGCIRLTCADAKWIYDNCAKGTTVEIYDSSDPGPLGKPTAIKIDVNSPYAGWDPTDPDANNPWKQQESQPVIPDAGQEQPDNSENQTVQPNAPDNEENEQPLNPGEGSSDAEDVPEV